MQKATREESVNGQMLLLAAALSAGILTACAGTAPSKEGPVCGAPIEPGQVLALDVEPAGTDPDAVGRYVRAQVGPYRLVTSEPVGLRNGGVPRAAGMKPYLRLPREDAAARGCDLMLVLGDRMDWLADGRVDDAGRLERLVIVHLGVREDGSDD